MCGHRPHEVVAPVGVAAVLVERGAGRRQQDGVARLRQLGWQTAAIVASSALLRGSYHLYQGFGGFLGNAAMGVVFALFFMRFRRVGPLVIAHTVLDAVAFVGYALFAKHLAFLR